MRKILWWGSTPSLQKIGPFNEIYEAWRGLLGLDGVPVEGAIVWCTIEDVIPAFDVKDTVPILTRPRARLYK